MMGAVHPPRTSATILREPLPDDVLRSPRAARPRSMPWRDPRVLVGALLVSGSVLGGAALLGETDTTTEVLVARQPLAAGQLLEAEDLSTARVGFATADVADRYLPADTELGSDVRVRQPVGAGELFPRAALATGGDEVLLEVPLAVDPARVPAGLAAGATVDVWLAPPPDRLGADEAQPLLSGVPVVAVGRASATGPSGLRQVVVGLPDRDDDVARTVGGLDPARVLLVRRDR